MYSILEVIFSTLDFIYLHMYLNIFLHRKLNYKIHTVIIGIITFSMLVDYITQANLYNISSDIICAILMVIYATIYFKEEIKTILLTTILFNAIQVSISLLVINLIAGTTMKSIDQIMAFNTISRVCIVILVKLLIGVIIRILKNLKTYLTLDISYKYKYMLIGIFVFSYLCIAVITKVSLETRETQICRLAVIVIISFIVLEMAILALINQISKYLQEENTKKIIINSQEILNKSIVEIDSKEKALRKLKHDMLNHFSVLGYLIKSENLSHAMEYINNLQKEVEPTTVYFKTGNIIADAIINQKVEVGKRDGIKFNIKAMVPKEVKITAVREVEEEKRIIDINIHIHHTKLLINVNNTVAYNPIAQGRLIRRKKENYNEHGYGMKSIQYVVNKYDGYLDYKYEEKEFNISILLDIT